MKFLIYKKQKGFTLIELITAMLIFSIAAGAITGILISAIKQQKIILTNQLIFDQISYTLEYMSRALRMAAKDFNGDCVGSHLNYETTSSGQGGIKFINSLYNNKCQEFYLSDEGEIMYNYDISSGSGAISLTSKNKIKITKFKVNISGQAPNDNIQPLVTIFLEMESPYIKEATKFKVQTSISQRIIDIQ